MSVTMAELDDTLIDDTGPDVLFDTIDAGNLGFELLRILKAVGLSHQIQILGSFPIGNSRRSGLDRDAVSDFGGLIEFLVT